MDILVTYDIANTETKAGSKRLRRVAEVCERYGTRVQWSVFECRLSVTRVASMVGELLDEIDIKEDSVVVYRFPGDIEQWCERFGRPPKHGSGQPWIT